MSWKKQLVYICITAVCFVVPPFLSQRYNVLRKDTDFDSNISIYTYISSYTHAYHTLPLINPYAGRGIPTLGDPLSAVFNPVLIVPILLFGVEWGVRVAFFLCVVMAGMSMLWLLRYFKLSPYAALWGSILFMISGTLSSQFAAGHIEKFLSYPVVPLFFLVIFRNHLQKRFIVAASLIASYIFISGDVYVLWFITISYIAVRIYWLTNRSTSLSDEIMEAICIFLLFVLCSSPKLFPYIELSSHIRRYSIFNPFDGSIHAPFLLFSFIIPFGSWFYDRPFFQRIFGFYYNWYEYFAFITPIAFIPMWFVTSFRSVTVKHILYILCFVGALYIAMRYEYSPFHWVYSLFPMLGMFRVPQRIVLLLTPVVITLASIGIHEWIKTNTRKITLVVVCLSSLVWTGVVSMSILQNSFEPSRVDVERVVKNLRDSDTSEYSVFATMCCMQNELMKNHIGLVNFYYAWAYISEPNYFIDKSNMLDKHILKTWRPKYIISSQNADYTSSSYDRYMEDGAYQIWKTTMITIHPSI